MRSFGKIGQKFRSLSMQPKMFFSYSASMTLVVILLFLLMRPAYASYYTKQWKYSNDQAMDQAVDYIQNSLDNMEYVSKLLVTDKDIYEVISRPDFGKQRSLKEEYREFFELRELLSRIEIASSNYQVGFYVSDDVVYSVNQQYFHPISGLQSRMDYDDISARLSEDSGVRIFSAEKADNYLLLNRILINEASGDKKELISRVALPVSYLQTILKKTGASRESLVWLTDTSDNRITESSGSSYEDYKDLSEISSWYHKGQETYRIDGKECYIFRTEILGYGWNLYSLIPLSVMRRQFRVVQYLMLAMIVGIAAVTAIISYLLSYYYTKKLANLNETVYGLLNNDKVIRILPPVEGKKDEMDELYGSFYEMTLRLNHALLEQYRLGKNVKNAELKALQAQINPHFLYNTLDLINWGAMAHEAYDVAEIATDLGAFYRLSLNHGKSVLSVRDELEHVRKYVKIENVHFDGKIGFTIDVPEELMDYGCLNIILQPFVENSIVHGIAEHSEIESMQIYVTAKNEGKDLHFQIEDNGPGMDPDQVELLNRMEPIPDREGGYGIRNINFRMQLAFGERYHAYFESIMGEGTVVHILLPALSLEELEKQVE